MYCFRKQAINSWKLTNKTSIRKTWLSTIIHCCQSPWCQSLWWQGRSKIYRFMKNRQRQNWTIWLAEHLPQTRHCPYSRRLRIGLDWKYGPKSCPVKGQGNMQMYDKYTHGRMGPSLVFYPLIKITTEWLQWLSDLVMWHAEPLYDWSEYNTLTEACHTWQHAYKRNHNQWLDISFQLTFLANDHSVEQKRLFSAQTRSG